MTADAGWLTAARAAADLPPARPREPVLIGGAAVGSIEPSLADRLVRARLPIARTGAAWRVDGPAAASLAAIAAWLRRAGLAPGWRDELLDVADADGRVLASLERAVVRAFAVTTCAVHLVGCAADGGVWVQQRSHAKATDPGLWDTLMGGQVAAGEATLATLARETMEEAGLDVARLGAVTHDGRITVRRPVAGGYMVEHIEVYSATLPQGAEPRNLDGEVERFECLPIRVLGDWLAQGRFTLEATLILGPWQQRRTGALTATGSPEPAPGAAPPGGGRAPRS